MFTLLDSYLQGERTRKTILRYFLASVFCSAELAAWKTTELSNINFKVFLYFYPFILVIVKRLVCPTLALFFFFNCMASLKN